MAEKSPRDISKLQRISESLGELNHERFQDWETPFTTRNARPAILAFRGDVFIGIDVYGSFDERDFSHAQKTLRILSGLYGVLRPLDLMQPYRLEMGTALPTQRGEDLYGFWGDLITDVMDADLQASPGSKALVNLASMEYSSSLHTRRIDGRIITPVFLDSKNGGEHKIVTLFTKRARGAMTGWIIRERIKSIAALKDFTGMGYRFDRERSSADQPVFIREDRGAH